MSIVKLLCQNLGSNTCRLCKNSDDRLTRLEEQMMDIRLAVSTLLETATQHQQNFETLAVEMREMRVGMRTMQSDIQEMRSEIRGLQTENRRILDVLQNPNEE